MVKIKNLSAVGSWRRALDKARRTVGKKPLDREPSDGWKAHMLLAEHSPIRMVEYDWTFEEIEQFVTTHLVRHHEGVEKFVSTQRSDRTGVDRSLRLQTDLNNMDMSANAQAIINISRKRLCKRASPETRLAWSKFLKELEKLDPILVSKCVPECLYRGFCPEKESCGFSTTSTYETQLKIYREF